MEEGGSGGGGFSGRACGRAGDAPLVVAASAPPSPPPPMLGRGNGSPRPIAAARASALTSWPAWARAIRCMARWKEVASKKPSRRASARAHTRARVGRGRPERAKKATASAPVRRPSRSMRKKRELGVEVERQRSARRRPVASRLPKLSFVSHHCPPPGTSAHTVPPRPGRVGRRSGRQRGWRRPWTACVCARRVCCDDFFAAMLKILNPLVRCFFLTQHHRHPTH